MGAYLDTPVKDKNSEHGSNELMSWGLCSMQGWRCNQEDDHLVEMITQPADGQKAMLFCVWDGHGGKEVAEYAREKFKTIFIEQPEFKQGKYKEALIQSFLDFDRLVEKTEFGADTGCTSNVVYVNNDDIICANAGDSRAVLYSNG